MSAAGFAGALDAWEWQKWPPPERKRPQPTGIGQGATFKNGSSDLGYKLITHRLQLAAELDRRADVECTAGRHQVAERLAHRAAELRGWA